ncbi:uncharacterized protein LOC115081007 [Rhinatrema bivittatum]|uniref:uncharacterized protein LOC115081007 n=1 Tax=Rhinatrema bivittatum TaxID=194408 RepID=UPI00112C9C9D|nr:uncharacterized protein LOC115081007 [Rhinatrema bivittatum]
MTLCSPSAVRDPESLTDPRHSCSRLHLAVFLPLALLALAVAALGTFVLLNWPCEGREKAAERGAVVGTAGTEATAGAASAAAEIAAIMGTETASAEIASRVAEAAAAVDGAHLIAADVDLKETMEMRWSHIPNVGPSFIGPDFDYDPDSGRLKVHRKGLYYIYAQLSVACVMSPCTQAGTATLTLQQGTPGSPVLQIPLKLPSTQPSSVFMGTLFCLSPGDQLHAQLSLQGATNHQQLQLSQDNLNFFGLLRINTGCKE